MTTVCVCVCVCVWGGARLCVCAYSFACMYIRARVGSVVKMTLWLGKSAYK